MRLIDADALNGYKFGLISPYAQNLFHRTINEAPTIVQEQRTGLWIPVSERLPESCGMYIVTRKIYDCPDTAPIIMSDESWFDGQNTWHNDNRINHDRRYLSDVIAWMPLPEPYKGGDDDVD